MNEGDQGLIQCPLCGLGLEEGTAPGGVAIHDCELVQRLRQPPPDPMTEKDALGHLLGIAVHRSAEWSGKDIAAVIDALKTEGGQAGARGPSPSLLTALRGDPEVDDGEE